MMVTIVLLDPVALLHFTTHSFISNSQSHKISWSGKECRYIKEIKGTKMQMEELIEHYKDEIRDLTAEHDRQHTLVVVRGEIEKCKPILYSRSPIYQTPRFTGQKPFPPNILVNLGPTVHVLYWLAIRIKFFCGGNATAPKATEFS